MSYLTLAAGMPDFSKAVISFWFRVPKQSLDAASLDAPDEDDVSYNSPLRGILPFITFGPSMPISFDDIQQTDVIGVYEVKRHLADSESGPSWIGLKCYRGAKPSLMVKLQTDELAPNINRPPYAPAMIGAQPPMGDFFAVGDFPYFYAPSYAGAVDIRYIEPTTDHWHHLLISFDVSRELSGPTSVFDPSLWSGAKFWWAYDDVNYNGAYLHPYGLKCFLNPTGGAINPNEILTAYMLLCTEGVPLVGTNSFTYGPLPTSSKPIGIPSSSGWTNKIYRVELAELQIFTGVTLDTSSTTKRRAFIDAKGKPVSPTKEASPEDPQSGSIELLGKKPDILLHGSNDWKTGDNTGSLGIRIETDGSITKLPAGQFVPTAKIEAYNPDPSLHGDQGKTS